MTTEQTEEGQHGLVALINDQRIVLPLKAVMCDFNVQGALAEVNLKQIYHQDNNRAMDCTYVFPMPADASVFSCEACINGRVIKAQVKERNEAVKLAGEKKAAGHRTALVESERENLFTLTLTNLQPEDLIEVKISYIQTLGRLGEKLALSIPFNSGIRYIPGNPLLRTNRGKGISDDTDQVPDSSRISPPRIDQFHPDAAFIDLHGKIESGFARVGSFRSPSHPISAKEATGFVLVELTEKGTVPDCDFVLRWEENPGVTITPRAWACRRNKEVYALIEIRAPKLMAEAATTPQDIYFLVDHSGSMEGLKWTKAVEALQSCVRVLGRSDRVMITLFNDSHQDFAEKPMSPAELLADKNFANLAGVGATGGTEMAQALGHVLANVNRHSAKRHANLVLITDAQVGNDSAILEVMKSSPGLAIHTFGIDVALNDSLLQALCRQQGGTYNSFDPNDDIASAVTSLGRTLGQPVLLDLQLAPGWELAERRLPDLYAGQVHYAFASAKSEKPLQLTAKDAAGLTVELNFQPQDTKSPGPWLQWCKTRIQRLLAADAQSAEAIQLSKQAGIICELTAFIAWDEAEKVAVAAQEIVQPSMMPSNAVRFCLSSVDVHPSWRSSLSDNLDDAPASFAPPLTREESIEMLCSRWDKLTARLMAVLPLPISDITKRIQSLASLPESTEEIKHCNDLFAELERLVAEFETVQAEISRVNKQLKADIEGVIRILHQTQHVLPLAVLEEARFGRFQELVSQVQDQLRFSGLENHLKSLFRQARELAEQIGQRMQQILPEKKRSDDAAAHIPFNAADFDRLLIEVLKALGGTTPKRDVEAEAFERKRLVFDHPYWQELVGEGIPRWQKNIQWARHRAVTKGLMEPPENVRAGIWRLTANGWGLKAAGLVF